MKDPMSREYKDPAPIIVLISWSVEIERLGNERSGDKIAGAVRPLPSPHLRGSCLTTVAPILGH